MELETVSPSAPLEANSKTDENKAPPASSVPVNLRRWTPRRRGACGMCKLKKVRCEYHHKYCFEQMITMKRV